MEGNGAIEWKVRASVRTSLVYGALKAAENHQALATLGSMNKIRHTQKGKLTLKYYLKALHVY